MVLTSARSTLAAKTADLHLSLVMQVPGAGQVTGTGDGVVDFGADSGQVTVRYTGLPQEGGSQLMEVFVGPTLYLSTPGISDVVPGKSWISEPVSSSSSMTPGSSNPAAMFQLLTDEGDTVNALGPSTIDGEAVHGYHVSINGATIEQELAHSGLPPSEVQQAESMFGSAGIQMSVFIGDGTPPAPQDHLLDASHGPLAQPLGRGHRGHQQLRHPGLHHYTPGRPGRLAPAVPAGGGANPAAP